MIKRDIPAYANIYKTYLVEDPNKTLRLGQWFFNQFIRNQPVSTPYNFDALYNSTDFDVILDILHDMYVDYQWPMI